MPFKKSIVSITGLLILATLAFTSNTVKIASQVVDTNTGVAADV